uniref:Uncharacterized protein n=1 Tax=Toxoplasma gondii COUG TaxID=1074873 RepID=A0A2G8Y494_TOXGO|nr:hypothetical protein TGCOUG_392690 [Toxoplasma gondii COUG]
MRRCGDAEKRADEKSGRPRLAARKRRRGSPAWTADLSPRTRSKARRNFLQFKTKKNGGNGGKGGKRFSGDPPVPASSHFGRRGEEVTLLKRMPRHLGEAAGEEGYAAFLEKKTTKFPGDSSTRQRGRQPCQEEVERRESKKRNAGNEPPRQPERRQRRNKERKRSRKKEAEEKNQRDRERCGGEAKGKKETDAGEGVLVDVKSDSFSGVRGDCREGEKAKGREVPRLSLSCCVRK